MLIELTLSYLTPAVADVWDRVISGVCDFVCVSVSVSVL